MSMIAAMLVLAPAPAVMTPEQMIAAARARVQTAIDPCRKGGSDEDIVVCGRREAVDLLPLYDGDDGSRYAGGGGGATASELNNASAPCRLSGSCQSGGVDLLKVGGFIAKGIKALIDGE